MFMAPHAYYQHLGTFATSLSHDQRELVVLLFLRVSKAEVGHRQRSEQTVKRTRTRVDLGVGGRAAAVLAQIMSGKLETACLCFVLSQGAPGVTSCGTVEQVSV